VLLLLFVLWRKNRNLAVVIIVLFLLTVTDAVETPVFWLLTTGKTASMDFDDYESLPATSTVGTHMVAGAASGILEHCFMYPIDSVKVCSCHYFDKCEILLSVCVCV